MSTEDRNFVIDLVDKLKGYPQAVPAETPEVIAPDAADAAEEAAS